MHVESEVGNSHESASEDVLPTGDGVLIIDEVKVQRTGWIPVYRFFWCCCLDSTGYYVQPPYGSLECLHTCNDMQVGLRLVWSSRNQKFTGLCMTHNELSTLCDVYQTLSPEFRQKQTSYVFVA